MNGNIDFKVHSTVITSRSRDEVEAYLYGDTRIVEKVTDEALFNGYVLCTTITREYRIGDTCEQLFGEATRLAEYQCNRLQSGMINAHVRGTLHDAREDMINALVESGLR